MSVEELASGGLGGALVGAVLHIFNRLWKRSTDAETAIRAILKEQAAECEARYRALLAAVDARLDEHESRLDKSEKNEPLRALLPEMHEEVGHAPAE